MRKVFAVLLILAAWVIFSREGFASSFTKPSFKKVILVVMENTNYQDALNQPYFSELAKRGALFTDFIAATHPSQPNYIAMIAGDTLGVFSDLNADLDGNHLGDLLEQRGLSWKAYAQDYPGNCFLGARSGKYARKHVPFLSFKNVQANPDRCGRVVNASDFEKDIAANSLPNFSLYIPNLNNDGHDTTPAFADRWLAKTFGSKVNNPDFMKDTLLIVTFDESEIVSTRNQVYTVFLGGNTAPGSTVSTLTSHYSVLRTLETVFGLGSLDRNDAKAASIEGIWL